MGKIVITSESALAEQSLRSLRRSQTHWAQILLELSLAQDLSATVFVNTAGSAEARRNEAKKVTHLRKQSELVCCYYVCFGVRK